jgi:Flp pilus assembly protein TadG
MSLESGTHMINIDSAPLKGQRPLIMSAMKHKGGAVAAEFAIVLPVLMSLTFGTIEFGTMFYAFSSMQMAARDVTRQVAVNTLNVAGAPAELKSRLPQWMRNAATISIAESTPANPATNVYTTTLEIDASAATPLAFFSKATTWKLKTDVEMKQELPFVEPPKN